MLFNLFAMGQSNESGQGQTPGQNQGRGTPILDPTLPRGQNLRSWYPSMARQLGMHGHHLAVHNHCVGATSFTVNQVGIVVPWVSGMQPNTGLYVTSNGGVWKSNVGLLATIPSSTTAPTGSASYTTPDGIPWVYMRPTIPDDFTTRIRQPGDPLFDPRGTIAPLIEDFQTGRGFNVLALSIGQGDANLLMRGIITQNDFRDAYITLARMGLDNGMDRVLMGFTCYYAAYATTQYPLLVAGIADALASFSGDTRVRAGVNLWQAMGDLPTTTDPTVVGLYDGLHMTDAGYEKAGILWADALMASVI